MSCANPWLYQPNKKHERYHYSTNQNALYIPCGWCLNCRVDKQNQLTHRCEQELINYKCGAFVTLTYDDYHIIDKMRKDSKGSPVATLSKNDLTHYLYRLRKNIQNRMPDNLLSNHHFKYLAVGEYGGDGQIFDRPHIHLLFFGLDFAVCKKELQKAWKGQGIVKVLPILQGGIEYVLKYLDKQFYGEQAIMKYDNNNLERPFQNHSLGLGNSLYKNQLNYIKSHNGCYRWKGRDVPVPPYYKNKYYIKSLPEAQKVQNQFINIKQNYGLTFKNRYDLHDFCIQKNKIREQNLEYKNRLAGRPLSNYTCFQLKKLSKDYISNLSIQAQYIASGCPF